jgi:peptidoglycan hydrolase CwlO-like protein
MKLISKVFFVVFILFAPFLIYAQTNETQVEREIRLKAELAQVEKEQAETEKILAQAQGQSASINRDILILTTKIKAAQLNIKAKNLIIETLGKDIVKKQDKIVGLEEKIDKGRETLAQIMRKTNEIDSYTLAEFILAKDNLSTIFLDLDTFQSVQKSLKNTFEQIRDDKFQTESEKNTLNKKKNSEIDARAIIESEKKSIESNEKEKQRLLAISKSDEKKYAAELSIKKAKAAGIRAALFQLAGGSKAILFGDALKFAIEAQKATSIRPAFLLAVITQESNLGANVGSCLVSDLTTGDGIGKNTGTFFEQVMKSPRDTTPFVSITKALGRDWKSTPVSCPIGNTKYYVGRGFGGAMGPAQFIPSTWTLFINRISRALNISNPDPWNPEHAFVASSLYLTDLGAKNGSYTGEIAAACKYFGTGGSSCAYGKQVLAKANIIQTTMIDPLQGL